MRRDIGSEVVVAIVAVLLLAFALIFGVVLSLSGTSRGAVLAPTAIAQDSTVSAVVDGTALVQTLQVGTEVVRLLTASAAAPAVTMEASTAFDATATALAAEVMTAAAQTAAASPDALVPPTATLTRTSVPPSATLTRTSVPATLTRTSMPPSATLTRTPVPPSATLTRTPVPPTATLTNTPVPPSATLTRTPVPPTATLTNTPVPPSATLTRTPVPPTATLTRTPVPPTATLTPSVTPSRTATLTNTPTVTASVTASHTPTHTPSFTPTNTATNTLTFTPSQTPTPTHTFTSSNTPTHTLTHTPSRTPTPTNTLTPSFTPTPPLPTAVLLPADGSIPTLVITPQFLCALPFGWSTYVVQPGDTLYQIALAVGMSVGELRDINCLPNEGALSADLDLFVPQQVQVASPTVASPAPTAGPGTPTRTPRAAVGCSATAAITSPPVGSIVETVTTVFGTAASEGAVQYLLEVRPEGGQREDLYLQAPPPVMRAALGRLNPDFYPPGEYWLRLRLLDASGNTLEACAIPLIFR